MLLTIDVGNTKTVLGVFEGTRLADSCFFDTDMVKTADDALAQIDLLAEALEYDRRKANAGRDGDTTIERACMSCVVAEAVEPWSRACQQAFGTPLLICTASEANRLGLFDITFDNLNEIGADLVADAIAARATYGTPVVIIDYGTAKTVEFLNADGRFAGVSIAPGAESSMAALFKDAEAIQAVPVKAPEHVLGTTTIESVQSGIVFGEAARADGLTRRGLREMGCDGAPVVATGGLCEVISAHSEVTTAVDKMLTLKGLQMMDAANEAAKKAAEARAAAAAAEEERQRAAEEEARLKTFRSGDHKVNKVTGLKGSPLRRL